MIIYSFQNRRFHLQTHLNSSLKNKSEVFPSPNRSYQGQSTSLLTYVYYNSGIKKNRSHERSERKWWTLTQIPFWYPYKTGCIFAQTRHNLRFNQINRCVSMYINVYKCICFYMHFPRIFHGSIDIDLQI